MTRSLRVLVLAFLAALSLAAVFAAVALSQFESEIEETQLTANGNGIQLLRVSPEAPPIECAVVTVDKGLLKGKASTTASGIPTYAGCKEFLKHQVVIDTNGCEYVFHLPKEQKVGTMDVECAEVPNGIEITVLGLCTYKISTQTGLGQVTFGNKGAGAKREVELEAKVKNIVVGKVAGGAGCPAGGNAGSYEGKVTITGEKPGAGKEQVGIFVD